MRELVPNEYKKRNDFVVQSEWSEFFYECGQRIQINLGEVLQYFLDKV